MEIIKTIDDIIAASKICAKRDDFNAPKKDFEFEPAYAGYQQKGWERHKPYWVLQVKGEETCFIYDEEYEQGRWIPFFREDDWCRSSDFVFENPQKVVHFETKGDVVTSKTLYKQSSLIAFTKEEARYAICVCLSKESYREYCDYKLVSIAPRLQNGLPVWLALLADPQNPEKLFYGYLEIRLQDDYDGGQFKKCEYENMPFVQLQKDACYLLSTRNSILNYHHGCPLMAVRFNGTGFEHVPLSEAELNY